MQANTETYNFYSFTYHFIFSKNNKKIVFSRNFPKINISNNIKGKNSQNNNDYNKFFRRLCDNFILFNYSTIIKQENPIAIVIFILFSVLSVQSLLPLKIYLVVLISLAAFVDICYKVPVIGYPVFVFLKRHATPELFLIIRNLPFNTFFAKISGSAAIAAIVKPAIVVIGISLSVDYVASTTGWHQLANHITQDYYNGQKTIYKHDHSLNKKPYIDTLIMEILKPQK